MAPKLNKFIFSQEGISDSGGATWAIEAESKEAKYPYNKDSLQWGFPLLYMNSFSTKGDLNRQDYFSFPGLFPK